MELCTSCNKNPPSIHVLDLQGGQVMGQQHICQSCAENAGVVQPKATPLKLSSEILEDLIGGLTGKKRKKGEKEGPVCPACGLSAADFRVRGRLGCPRCYTVFKASLVPLLERVHDATSHRGRFPGRTARSGPRTDKLADLRRRLEVAIEEENYEEAANLRDQLRQLEDAPSQEG